jgi:hypothetical protein
VDRVDAAAEDVVDFPKAWQRAVEGRDIRTQADAGQAARRTVILFSLPSRIPGYLEPVSSVKESPGKRLVCDNVVLSCLLGSN